MQELVGEECRRWASKGINIKRETREQEWVQSWGPEGRNETQLREQLRVRSHIRC